MTTEEGALFELPAEAGDDWDGPGTAPTGDAALYLELDGWEGPLDLLLDLARRQKVDLKAISILALVDQYLAYIERAEALRLEIAADYLVMAAWLAYLKSALLLPKDEQEDPSPEELALRLQLRLQRLGAMREAAARLLGARPGRPRRVPARRARGPADRPQDLWQCDWYSLVSAYGQVKARNEPVVHMVRDRMVMTLDSALDRVSAHARGQARLDRAARFPARARRAAAQALGARLELRRRARAGPAGQGRDPPGGHFGPLHLRRVAA